MLVERVAVEHASELAKRCCLPKLLRNVTWFQIALMPLYRIGFLLLVIASLLVACGRAADSGKGTCNGNECASLCTGAGAGTQLSMSSALRGTWQFNPGGPYVTLPASGYPCAAFAHDKDVRPSARDPRWTDATDGAFIGFSESSTLQASGYTRVQFRYFRALLHVPSEIEIRTLKLAAQGIDDSLHVVIYNSTYPDGTSPTDAGPSDPSVGVCNGNGSATWDLAKYIRPGEINTILLVHSDMQPPFSSLTRVDILLNDESVPTFDCRAP